MKIKGEQLGKIVEEEVLNVLKEVWQPSQTAAKIADKYARLQVDDRPELSLGTDKQKEKQQTQKQEPLKSMSGSELQKQIRILMAQTNPIFLMQIKPLIDKFGPEKFLSDIVKRARIDPSLFEKDLTNFIDKLEQYSSISLKEDLKQDFQRKRKLIANIDRVMSSVRNQIFLKLSQLVEKDIDRIRQELIEYIENNKDNLGEVNKQIAQKLLSFSMPADSQLLASNRARVNKWLLDNLKQDIMAVSNSLVLITKQTILNAYSQKKIKEQIEQQ